MFLLESIPYSRYQFLLLFSPIIIYFLGEAVVPNLTAHHPILFIFLLTLPFIVFFNFYDPSNRTFSPQSSVGKAQTPSTIASADSASSHHAQLLQPVVKPILKQQLFNLNEALSTYEKNLQAHLFSQVEKTQSDSITVLTSMQESNRFPLSIQAVLQAIQQPYVRHGLKVYAWPVVSLPQKKTSLISCDAGIFISQEHGFAKLSSIESKASKGNHGGLLFLIFFKSVSLVREQFKALPQVPIVIDIPSTIFDYPKLVQHLFDYLEHKDFPHHRFLWRIQESAMTINSAIINRIHELGGNYIVNVSYPRIEPNWPYMQIDASLLQKITSNQAHRQNHQLLNDFALQSSKVIIADVPQQYNWHDLNNISFDFAYGPSVAQVQVIENLTPTPNLFSHDVSLKIA